MNKIIGLALVSALFMVTGCSKKDPPQIFEKQIKPYNDSKDVEGKIQAAADAQRKEIDAASR